MALTYEQREAYYACKVCGNVPDESGNLEHGRGCYVMCADGGGSEHIDMKDFACDFDISSLDCTGIFEPAKPPKKAHRYPRRAQNKESTGEYYGYAEQLFEGSDWVCKRANGELFSAGNVTWKPSVAEQYIERGNWIESFDHHADAGKMAKQIERTAAQRANHIATKVDELRDEIARLNGERDEALKRCAAMEDLIAADPVRELVEWCKWFKEKETRCPPYTGKR